MVSLPCTYGYLWSTTRGVIGWSVVQRLGALSDNACAFRSLILLSVARGLFGGVSQAMRALREVARVRLCADVDSLLRAVSVVMTADCDGKGGDDPTEPFGDETAGGSLPEGFTSNSLSEVRPAHALFGLYHAVNV